MKFAAAAPGEVSDGAVVVVWVLLDFPVAVGVEVGEDVGAEVGAEVEANVGTVVGISTPAILQSSYAAVMVCFTPSSSQDLRIHCPISSMNCLFPQMHLKSAMSHDSTPVVRTPETHESAHLGLPGSSPVWATAVAARAPKTAKTDFILRN